MTSTASRDGRPGAAAWEPGTSPRRRCRSSRGTLEIADAGDFETDQAFSYGAWVKLAKAGAIGRGRRPDGRPATTTAAGTSGSRSGRVAHAHHPQVARRRAQGRRQRAAEAGRVEPRVRDLRRLGQGRRASRSTSTASAQADRASQVDTLQGHDPHRRSRSSSASGTRRRGSTTLAIQDLRLYGRRSAADEVEQLRRTTRAGWLVAKPADKRTDGRDERAVRLVAGRRRRGRSSRPGEARPRSSRRRRRSSARGTIAHVMQERTEPPMAYILFRGEYDKRRDPVQADTPAALPPLPADLPRNRLGLAQWLLRPEHPLTARVTVNRFWQEVFGTGLVRTSRRLRRHRRAAVASRAARLAGGRVPRVGLGREAVLQAAGHVGRPIGSRPRRRRRSCEKDPQNRLLSRGPRFRMDAEMVRDYALAASGLLVEQDRRPERQAVPARRRLGGGGHDRQQHARLPAATAARTSTAAASTPSGSARAPPASMDIFNAPSREICTVRRERTNTPLQALVTLNDPQFVEAARNLAERTLKEGGATSDEPPRLPRPRGCWPGRSGPRRAGWSQDSLDDLLAYYQSHPDDAQGADRRRRVEGRPGARRRRPWRPGPCWPTS